jgi:hypothetical protein
MVFHYSPKIVNSGLILYLDAANTKSFQVGSVTWNDLSRSNSIGILQSGATYSSLNGGCIVFDGVDDVVGFSNVNILSYTGSGTIDFIYKVNSTPASDFRNVWGFTNNLFQYENNGGFMLFVWRYADLTYAGASTGISQTDLNTYHITCTYTTIGSSTFKVYKNGVLTGSSVVSKPLINSTNSFSLGGTSNQNCNIYNIKIYNRELSSSEVLQNFNALKSRFGL